MPSFSVEGKVERIWCWVTSQGFYNLLIYFGDFVRLTCSTNELRRATRGLSGERLNPAINGFVLNFTTVPIYSDGHDITTLPVCGDYEQPIPAYHRKQIRQCDTWARWRISPPQVLRWDRSQETLALSCKMFLRHPYFYSCKRKKENRRPQNSCIYGAIACKWLIYRFYVVLTHSWLDNHREPVLFHKW